MHTIHLYIVDIFPYRLDSVNLTEFGLVGRNYVIDTITHLSPMCHYRMLVIYCINPPLKVWNKKDIKGSH